MLEYYLIEENQSLKTALDYINKNPDKCLVVKTKHSKLLGTITDGDIRRAIIKGLDFKNKINKIYNKKPYFIKLKNKFQKFSVSKKLIKNYSVIPIVNKNKQIIKLYSLNLNKFDKIDPKNNLKIDIQLTPVVMMAGGEGKRLLPHTNILPKPLMPYKGKSLAEHIIQRFQDYGFYHFYFTIKYKSNLMKAYFSNITSKIKIKFIQENKSLGTAGALRKLKSKKQKTFFVINCDSLIRCDYLSLLNYHKENKNDLTLVVSKKKQVFNYGTCLVKKNGSLAKIIEKPQITHLANTGLYVVEKKTFKFIHDKEKLDMDQFIQRLLKKKMKIGVFPIDDEEWKDLGTLDNF